MLILLMLVPPAILVAYALYSLARDSAKASGRDVLREEILAASARHLEAAEQNRRETEAMGIPRERYALYLSDDAPASRADHEDASTLGSREDAPIPQGGFRGNYTVGAFNFTDGFVTGRRED